MRKYLSILFLLVVGLGQMFAQRIDYYHWTKTYLPNGSVRTETDNHGLFVTRRGQVCYDSNNKGASVENGKLNLVKQQDNVSKYVGSCYYGDECTYTFYDSEGVLNIETMDKTIYVFVRETPPSSRSTCSLIKPKAGAEDVTMPVIDTPDISDSDNNGKGSSYEKKTAHPKKCRKCVGRGICTVCTGRGTYLPYVGASRYVKCSTCNGTGRCSLCNGSGEFGHEWY